LFFLQIFSRFIVPLFQRNLDGNIDPVPEGCKGKWFWYNLLFINAYVEPHIGDDRHICLGQAWYLLCDMTFFLFIPPLALMYNFGHKHGTTFLVFLALIGNMVAVGIWLKVNGCAKGDGEHCKDSSPFFFDYAGGFTWMTHTYNETWSRYGACAVGILFAQFWDLGLKDVKKFPWFYQIPIALTSFLLMGLVCYGPYAGSQDLHYTEDYYSYADRMWYGATYRPVWCIGLALMCLLCFKDQFPFVNWFLSHAVWKPWARVSFIMFLIQFDVMFSLVGGNYWQRMSYNNWFFAIYFMGLMCLCFMLSYVFLVLAEKPFGKYVKFGLSELQKMMAPPKPRGFAATPNAIGSGHVSVNDGASIQDDRSSRRSKRSQRRSHLSMNPNSNKSNRDSNRSAQEDLIFFDSDNEGDEGLLEGAGSHTGQDSKLAITSKTPTNQEL